MTENKNTDELMQVGRTAGAYGVRGWVRVVPMGRQGDLVFALSEKAGCFP